ncbi:MAG: PQQ-binding-like beta-propeller repeat protein [Opitutales bacterium]
MLLRLSTILACTSLAAVPPALATEIGWRNDGTGLYPEASPPLNWSDSENVLWQTKLPDWGNSMPVLVGDKIFLTCEPDRLICLSAETGEILWESATGMEDALSAEARQKLKDNQATIAQLQADIQKLRQESGALRRKVRRAEGEERARLQEQRTLVQANVAEKEKRLAGIGGLMTPRAHPENGYTSATPVSDGNFVYTVFGTGVIAAHDLDGNRVWAKLHEQPTHVFGHSSSPRLIDGKLIVHILTLMAINPKDGAIVWEADLPSSWGTPAVTEIGDTPIIITAAGDIVRASDGHLLGSEFFELNYGCPIVQDGKLYAIDENGGWAYQLPESIEGDTIELAQIWTNNPPRDRYYSSPVVVDGVLYTCNRARRFTAFDAATGEQIFSEVIPFGQGRQLYGSFSYAGGHLFVSHDNGQVATLREGKTYDLVNINSLDESKATPLFVGDRVFMRTHTALYCLSSG